MAWIVPIIDRTQSDVSSKKEKGYINYTDLNRIEGNCNYLSQLLNDYGYFVSIDVKTNWQITDFPTQSQVDRIRNNILALINCYARKQGSPEILFKNTLDFNDANSLEKNLANIDILINQMIQGFRYSGGFNFYSGSGVVLP